VTKPIAIHS